MTPPNKPKRSAESSTRRPSARGEGLTARRKVSERLSEKLNKPLELFGMDVEKEREHISDALDDIDDQLDDLLTVDRKIPRIKAGISSIKITLKAPIRRYKVRWTALRVKYLSPPNGKSVTQGDSEKYTAELKTLIEEIEQYVKNVTAYIKELREGEGGYLTEAVIMRLETEGPKFVAALQGDKEMQEAMTAILKGFSGDKEAKKVYQKVTNQIDKMGFKSEKMATLWMAISMMNVNEKVAFAKFYLKRNAKITAKEFMMEASKFGAMGTLEAREILDYDKLSDKEKRNISIRYDAVTQYTKEARRIYRHSIGSDNAASRMITLGNMGFAFAKFATATTVVANTAVALFRGGYKDIGMIIKNPVIIGGAGGYVALKAFEGNEPVSKRFESKDSRDRNNKLESLAKLRDGLQGTKGEAWGGPKGFFKLYADVFGEFVQKAKHGKDEIPKIKMTREKFLEFIEKKHGTKSAEYLAFKKMADAKGINTTDESILYFAQIFDYLNIGGIRSGAKSTYIAARTEALSLR